MSFRSKRSKSSSCSKQRRASVKKTPNRVAGGISPPAPTPPTVRVRSGRFNKSARSTKRFVPSSGVALGLAPPVLHADQALRFQPRVGQRLLQCRGCCHVPARLASLGLVCGFCPSPRTSCTPASSRQNLAALPLPSARGYPSLTMSPSRYSHRGLAPHKFAPMLGAHPSFQRTRLRRSA